MSNVYPAIPDPQPTVESLAESVRMLKVGVEVLTGQRPGGAPGRIYIQSTAPTALKAGDQWIDDSGKYRYWTGSDWLLAYQPTIPGVQTLLDGISTTQGTTLYRGASGWVGLAPSTAGYVLQTNGAGADPSWVAPTWTEGVLTADRSVTNSAALTNATGLSFSVTSGAYYSFVFGLLLENVTARGVQIAITTPSSGLRWGVDNSNSVAGTATSGTGVNVIPTASASGSYALTINGIYNCATTGTLQLQFAEISAAASTSATIYKGSWFRYRTV